MTSVDPPALETGWEPETPHDDTALRHGTVAMAATWELVGRAHVARIHGDDRFQAVDLGRPTGLFNSATLVQPLPGDALAEVVGRVARFYDAQGSSAALLWGPWPTPDLSEQGWRLQGHPPLLYRPAGAPPNRRGPDELTISTVTTAAGLAEWCALAVEAFPLSDVAPPDGLLDRAVLDDPRFRFVIGHVGQRAMAAGCQVTACGANVLLLSTVRPEGRGRGDYAALVAHRLAQSPDLPTVTLPRRSRPLRRHRGRRPMLGTRGLHHRMPGKSGREKLGGGSRVVCLLRDAISKPCRDHVVCLRAKAASAST